MRYVFPKASIVLEHVDTQVDVIEELSGEATSVKLCERSNGLDTAPPFFYFTPPRKSPNKTQTKTQECKVDLWPAFQTVNYVPFEGMSKAYRKS